MINYRNPVSTRHRFDIHTTSITLKRRRMDVKTTSCAYWEWKNDHCSDTLEFMYTLCINLGIDYLFFFSVVHPVFIGLKLISILNFIFIRDICVEKLTVFRSKIVIYRLTSWLKHLIKKKPDKVLTMTIKLYCHPLYSYVFDETISDYIHLPDKTNCRQKIFWSR